jgi:hypothetical protein
MARGIETLSSLFVALVIAVLGMRTEDREDSKLRLTLDRMDPTNHRPKVRVATHLCLTCKIKSATRSSSGGGSALRRTQGNGGLTSMVTFLYRRPEDGEGAQDGGLLDR